MILKNSVFSTKIQISGLATVPKISIFENEIRHLLMCVYDSF